MYDLVIINKCRRQGVGKKLIKAETKYCPAHCYEANVSFSPALVFSHLKQKFFDFLPGVRVLAVLIIFT